MNTKGIVMNFKVEEVTNQIIEWIKDWFDINGNDCNAIVGISGGIDSSTVAALCVKALGKDRVKGVLMPNGEQNDIEYSHKLVNELGIESLYVNIEYACEDILNRVLDTRALELSSQTQINLPARIRMSVLYAISQSMNGRVANTCNLSEDWVGYSTRYGDAAGDFSPLANITKTEVKEIAEFLGLSDELVNKVPTDGLCGKTDEENLGFTYAILDKYIRTGICDDSKTKKVIDYLHNKNKFKLELMQSFQYV